MPGEPKSSTREWFIKSSIATGFLSLLIPECLTFMAIAELFEARGTQKRMQRSTTRSWTLTHSFFLHMGGFCLESPSGFRLQLGESDIEYAISGDPQASAHSLDWLSKLQKVSEDQIQGHAKSNRLTKLISCVQTLWLVTQVISRACQHQAITLLEISATAYAVCALVAYVAWWKKPQSCDLPIMIPCSDEAFPHNTAWNTRMYFCNRPVVEIMWAGQNYGGHFDAISFQRYGINLPTIALCKALFRTTYFASWHFALLSHVERWLWRASMVYCCSVDIFVWQLQTLLSVLWRFNCISRKKSRVLSTLIMYSAFSILPIIRLFMIFELFFNLRALPPSAYESVQWMSFLPHI